MELTLLDVAGLNFKTTEEADKINDELMKLLGMRLRYGPARIAIARSLSMPRLPLNEDDDEYQGRVIKGSVLFGSGTELGAWIALIREAQELGNFSKKDLQKIVAAHWHRGAKAIWHDWEMANTDLRKFLINICENSGFVLRAIDDDHDDYEIDSLESMKSPLPVIVKIGEPGTDIRTGEKVTWTINGPGISPHLAAMGMLGTGKTRLAMQLLEQIQAQSGCGSIIFDFKGDLAENGDLCDALQATIINCHESPIPLDILKIYGDDDASFSKTAIAFRDSFNIVAKNQLGGAQLDDLRDIVTNCLQRNKVATLRDIRDEAINYYDEIGKKKDLVISTLNDLCSFELFTPELAPNKFFKRVWIVDLHQLSDSIQRFIAFIMFDSLNSWMMQLRDAPINTNGYRAIRFVLAIDEARKVLGYNHPSLVNVVRMSRSKGGLVMLISQSPDDFDREKEDFIQNIGLAISFRTNAKPSSLKRVLGESTDLAGLENGVCITRLPSHGAKKPIKIKVWT